jgi:hypothetical protein
MSVAVSRLQRVSNLRDETTSKNLVVSAGNCCDLDDNTNDENTSASQDTVLAGESLSNEARHHSTKPGTKLEDGSQPTLLCWVVNVSIGF